MHILILGAKGQLGVDLMNRASNHQWRPFGFDLPEVDITNKKSLLQAFEQATPLSAVINAAAYTAVDRAETDVDLAYAVNRDGPQILAQLCDEKNIPLVHVSTDYVFDGSQTRPYRPADHVNPMGIYGKSKADGETVVRNICTRHVIVRTSWLYGLHGPNFVKTMLRLGREREELQVVDDQIGSPTYAGDLADALLSVARYSAENQNGWGTHHFCNSGVLSWHAFASKIFDLARLYVDLKVKEVTPIPTDSYPTPAPRPRYSVMDCTSLENIFSITRRHWQEALEEMITALHSSNDFRNNSLSDFFC